MDKIKDMLRLTFGDPHKEDRKHPFATRSAFPNKQGKKGGGKSWRLRKFGTKHVDPVDQDQDDYYEYYEEEEEDGDEQNGQDDHKDEQEEDQDAEQDPEAAPEDDNDQDDDDDLQELFGALLQLMRREEDVLKDQGMEEDT